MLSYRGFSQQIDKGTAGVRFQSGSHGVWNKGKELLMSTRRGHFRALQIWHVQVKEGCVR